MAVAKDSTLNLSKKIRQELNDNGFVIKNKLFSNQEIDALLAAIDKAQKAENTFAIRQFLKIVPLAIPLIFTENFKCFVKEDFGEDYFLIKAIYFDKPPTANWIVPWHQDLTIVTAQKEKVRGFSKWRLKKGINYVHPPVEILENILTIRIHLDNCTKENGALQVIPASHKNGIGEKLAIAQEKPVICEVKRGGVLVMKPLLYHASKRTANNLNRRVIHLEFIDKALSEPLIYGERIDLF